MFSEALIHGCQQGDRRSQRDLYTLCHPILYRVALRYTKDKNTATEIVTNAYLKIIKSLGYINNESNIAAWVHRIGVNCAIDAYRSNKKYLDTIKVEGSLQYNVLENVHFDANTIDKHLEASYVMKIISMLPDNTREVMNMYAIDGYSHKEISSMLQISEETSRWHLHKGRKLIAEELKKFENLNTAKVE